MSRLFGNENISLRRSEIYVNKNKGTKCKFDLNNSRYEIPRNSIEYFENQKPFFRNSPLKV